MKRHDLDLTSLVSGLVFVAVGIVFLLDLTVDYSVSPRWVTPLVLIGIGVAGLLSTVQASRRTGAATSSGNEESSNPPSA